MLNSIRLGKALIAALVAALLPMGVHAQTWPTQTVRFVVPTPAGSSVDIVARVVAERFPSLKRAVNAALRRGDEGKNGGLVVVESADGLAGTFASKTGRSIEAARSILQARWKPP